MTEAISYVSIATVEPARWLALCGDVMGMSVVGDELVPGDLYGHGGSVRRLMLAQEPLRTGMIQLLAFDPPVHESWLAGAVPLDTGYIRTVDVFTSDHAEASSRLAANGFRFRRGPHTYDAGQGMTATEGFVDAPDGVTFAVLQMRGAPRETFCRGTALFGELGASSHVVESMEDELRFWRAAFGFDVHYDFHYSGAATPAGLLELPVGAGLRMTVVAAPGANTAKLARMEYTAKGRSLAGQARPPRRGLVSHGFLARAADVEAAGGRLEAAPRRVPLAPFGEVELSVASSPCGVRLELFWPVG